MQIDRFTPYASLTSPAGATPPAPAAPRRAVDAAQDEGTIVGSVPPAPTAEARAMVDRAADRVQQLQAQNRELHFTRDEASNRVIIEVRDLDGNVIRTIPPSKALDVMSGAEL